MEAFDENLIEIKPSKQPVGYEEGKDEPFSTKRIQLLAGDCVYVFSDGYADQFGGARNKKFSSKRFKKTISSLHSMPMDEQRSALADILMRWRDEREQLDDICVVGVRV